MLLLVAALGSACGGRSAPGIHEQLDPLTGVTVTRAGAPVVLYRDISARAANARDYVYLGPVEVNRMGELRYFLWLGIWTTATDAYVGPISEGFEAVVIYADGEPLLLESAGWTPSAIGVSESVYVKPVASALDVYYAVTIDQIRMLAEARDLRLQTTAAGSVSYEPWDAQDAGFAAMRTFVDSAWR